MTATPDRAGRYPIHYQALEGRVAELEQSLQLGLDASVADSAGFTPLRFAAQSLQHGVAGSVRLDVAEAADPRVVTSIVEVFDFTFSDPARPGYVLPASRQAQIRPEAGLSTSVPMTAVQR